MIITKTNMRQFFIYAIIGGISAILDYGTFYILETKFEIFSPEAASVFGQTVGFLFSFFANTYFNFKKTDKLFKRFVSYLTIVLIGMVISTAIIAAFKNIINIYLLKFLCLAFVSVLQFVLNKLFTYKKIK